MVSQCTLELILLKTCYLKCLIRHDTIWWWAELSDSHRFRPYVNTDPIVKLLAYYIGLFDLTRKQSCFCCFSNLFENSLNVQCIHNLSHILLIFDENTRYMEKIGVSMAFDWSRLAKQAYNDRLALPRSILYKLALVNITYELINE